MICDHNHATACFGRAHGLPKTQKPFSHLPNFRPIIDTSTTPHNVGKFLSQLLNPLTLNKHTIADFFHAVSTINSIPTEVFDHCYKFVSFDVESLFTNVPLTPTIEIILKRVFNDKLVKTTVTKRTLKKLLKDSCTKTAFSFNNIFEQIDIVFMGSCIAHVLANIILTEVKTHFIDDLINSGLLKFNQTLK